MKRLRVLLLTGMIISSMCGVTACGNTRTDTTTEEIINTQNNPVVDDGIDNSNLNTIETTETIPDNDVNVVNTESAIDNNTIDNNTIDNNANQDMDNAGQHLQDAGEDIKDSIENTGDAIKDTVEGTSDAMDPKNNDTIKEKTNTTTTAP